MPSIEEAMLTETNTMITDESVGSDEILTLDEIVNEQSGMEVESEVEEAESIDQVELLYLVKHETIFWPAVGYTTKASPKEVIKLRLLN